MLYRKYRKKYRKNKKAADRFKKIAASQKREIIDLRRQVSILENGYIVEWCQSCDHQVTMLWDVKKDGCKACCPFCGELLMLCDSCQGECDYNYGNDTCKEM